MKYEILEHKADLKIKVFGKTKEELFKNALLAMAESQKGENFSEKVTRKIEIQSIDLISLLVDFLSEALYLSQVEGEIYNNVKFKKFSDPSTNSGQAPSAGSGQTEIEGELIGQKVERFGEDIKAVTYHNLNIIERGNRIWEATVLFDI